MHKKGFSPIWTLIALVVLIALGFWVYITFLSPQTNGDLDAPEMSVTDESAIEPGTQLSRIVDNPDQYYDKKATVRGEIQDLYSRRILKLSDQPLGDELIVVLPRSLTEAEAAEVEEFFEDNANATVTGTVRLLTVADIEQDFDLDISGETEIEFGTKPVMVAESFQFTDGSVAIDFTEDAETVE